MTGRPCRQPRQITWTHHVGVRVARVGASSGNKGWGDITPLVQIVPQRSAKLLPSSFSESLLNLNPLGSLPTKWCVSSLPRSWMAMAYSSGFTHDCRQKGTLVSPTECLWTEEQGGAMTKPDKWSEKIRSLGIHSLNALNLPHSVTSPGVRLDAAQMIARPRDLNSSLDINVPLSVDGAQWDSPEVGAELGQLRDVIGHLRRNGIEIDGEVGPLRARERYLCRRLHLLVRLPAAEPLRTSCRCDA